MLGNETSVTQKLMFPEVLVFSADDTALLTDRYEEFLALGFEYVRRDENSIEVTGIPADFSVDEIQDLLYDIMDALSDGTQPVEEGRERTGPRRGEACAFRLLRRRDDRYHGGALRRRTV